MGSKSHSPFRKLRVSVQHTRRDPTHHHHPYNHCWDWEFSSTKANKQARSYMEKSGLELDLLNMDKSSHSPTFDRKRSFRDIQGLISKINPEVLKSVIANGCVLDSNKSSLCIPPETQRNVPSVPVCDPTLRLSNWCGENDETAPMTIFYNGKVSVFDVSSHKAQDILKLAEEGGLPKSAECSESKQTAQYLLRALNGDLPIARRKSLHSFLEKRKERLIMESPYLWSTNGTNSRKSVPARRD